jgi:hypothetical protein
VLDIKPIVLAALVAAAPLPALGFDMVGTWEGKQVCSGFDFDGQGARFQIESLITVSQSGDQVFLRVGERDYAGLKIDDPRKPERGRLYLVRCSTDNVPGTLDELEWDETADVSIKTKANGAGSLKGFSTFIDISGIGSCKWKYKRVDLTDPGLTGCAP